MNNLILNFPEGFNPRDKQAKALNAIEKAFENGKKFVIVHADTGVGKTHLAKTLGNVSKDVPAEFERIVRNYSIFGDEGAALVSDFEPFGCYALTITKSLQDQYQMTFDDTGLLKGKSNYQCDVDDTLSVDVAPCIYVANQKNECWKANRCPYYNSRNEMLTSKFSTLNYSMFFSLPNYLKKRQVMVCDEGSELEEQLVSQFTCEVDIPFLMKTQTLVTPFPNDDKNKPKVLSWINSLFEKVETSCADYKEWFSSNTAKKDIITFNKKKQEYTKLTNLYNSLGLLSESFYDSDYIIERVEYGIRFIPLKVDVLSKHLFSHAEKVVIMSATIIDPEAYCKSLGIKDYEYLHIGTDFNPEKSPIHIMAKQKLNFQNLKSMLPQLVKQIKGILEHHGDEKGIIHTHTQYLTDYIRDNVKSDRLLCREPGVNNEQLLEMHEESEEPTVLVSPSMTYGVDLKGDLARFQIILKAPWLPTKDVRVEKLMKLDKDWYGNQMLKTLVQACGRGVRSKDDWCITYILDGSIFDAIQRNKKKLPKFFIERFS
jgi:ATP-dependent DNA helicase DinG